MSDVSVSFDIAGSTGSEAAAVPNPSLIDSVAFHKLDQRLAAALLGHGNQLNKTHQDLANELGTVREVVTRLLRRFEREGWISQSREHINIVDAVALRAICNPDPILS